jgi:predicted amidophosphoribosyltransferase
MSNFKKKMDHRGRPDWPYKAAAIHQVAQAFAGFYTWVEMHQTHRVALVPIPPSKARADPMYDPRMREMLIRMAGYVGLPLDIRDCLSFSGQYGASHLNGIRATPDQLHADLTFDPVAGRTDQPPGAILVFDDVLTAGAHYAAVARKLRDVFPNAPVYGSFIARRVIPNPFAEIANDF